MYKRQGFYNSTNYPNIVNGSGTYGYIPMWNGTQSLNNSVIYQNGTNVGIGTTSPNGLLHISKIASGSDNLALFIQNPTITDESLATIGFSVSTSDMNTFIPGAISWRRDTGGYSGLQFRTGNGGTNPSVRMTILDDGNVGISTMTPNSKLEVAGTFNASAAGGSIKLESDGDVRIGI